MSIRQKKKKEYIWICKTCNQIFKTRRELQAHYKENPKHRQQIEKPHYKLCCKFCGIERETTKEGMTLHEKCCKNNPNRQNSNWFGKHHSEKTKKLLSESMKKAHKEGRAGSFPTRKNKEHSYPEKWLIKILKNELNMIENVDYETEKYFYGQFLDFAWPEKKICIEMDGEQHERWVERQIKDKEKEKNLEQDGWKLLRIKWKDIYNNTQYWIQQILLFITTS